MAQHRTAEQQLAEAEAKIARLQTRKRSEDTRQKILIGAAVLAEVRDNPEFGHQIASVLKRRVTREHDTKVLQGLIDVPKPEGRTSGFFETRAPGDASPPNPQQDSWQILSRHRRLR